MITFSLIEYLIILSFILMQQAKASCNVIFAFGCSQKTSLIAQFCKQNHYDYLKNPIPEAFKNQIKNNCIVEGNVQLFRAIEAEIPKLRALFVGNQFQGQQLVIKMQYDKIGMAICCKENSYCQLRKSIFPTLIFLYGPKQNQLEGISALLSFNTMFQTLQLPENANKLIKTVNLNQNYIIKGFYDTKEEILIIEQHFNFHVIHLHYNRIDLPDKLSFFDSEFCIIPFLKNKPYYIQIKTKNNQSEESIKAIYNNLCPQLIYVEGNEEGQKAYLQKQLAKQGSIEINYKEALQIMIKKRLDIPYRNQKFMVASSIIYRHLNKKTLFISDLCSNSHEILKYQSINKKFSLCINLCPRQNYKFTPNFSKIMYFLEQQKHCFIDISKPLAQQISCSSNQYWIVTGPPCCGKSTVAKYLSSEFDFKLIEMQPYIAFLKEKLLAPEDGEELPFKKIVHHFKSLFCQDKSIFIFDGFQYSGKQLIEWIKVVGQPKIVNLKIQAQQLIKRTRKKLEADLAAEVGEQEKTKINQGLTKNNDWINCVKQNAPYSKVHIVDYNAPILLSQKKISCIFRKNVYLVQKNTKVIYQNIAINYDLGFINLDQNRLRESISTIKLIDNPNIILCYYQQNQNLISEDLYWIEKNIGDIKYLAIFKSEDKEIKDPKLVLDKKQPEKPKAEDQPEGEDKPVQEAEKKQMDIYSFEWSKPEHHRNLSQWFFNSKDKICQIKNNSAECYNDFQNVLKKVEQGCYIYKTIQE